MKPRFYLEIAIFQTFRFGLRILPRALALGIGKGLGALFYLLSGKHRKRALDNLHLAYGDSMDTRRKKEIAFGTFKRFGAILLNTVRDIHPSLESIERYTEVQGWEHLEQARAMGKGTLILTGHLGYWELLAVAQGYRGEPMHVLARKLDNPFLERLLQRFRTCSGNSVIHKQNAIRQMIKLLRENGIGGVLMDQNVTLKEGIFVDFFGVPACTTTVASALALKTGAAIVPVFAVPLPRGRWRFVYEPPIVWEAGSDKKQATIALTQHCTTLIEQFIRRYPDAWLWMHRRWKTRPPEEQHNPTALAATSSHQG